MHSWHWHTWQGLPYLRCSLLTPWSHGFFTRQFCPRPPAELAQVLQPEVEVYRVKQVHGNAVLTPTEISKRETEKEEQNHVDTQLLNQVEADGLVTEQPQQAVWVASADCTPVLIADSRTGQVAAVHSGWRGTAAKIVPQAIARLQAQGSQLQNLHLALGPAIAGVVYQVSAQVAAEVGASIISDVATASIVAHLSELENSPLIADPEPGKVRLDIRRVIALQLAQLGISSEQIAIAPHCTYQEPEYFFSYRREQQKKVQWSGIISN